MRPRSLTGYPLLLAHVRICPRSAGEPPDAARRVRGPDFPALPRRAGWAGCWVALAMYGLRAFYRAVRFFGLRSIVHDVPSRLKATSFAFADPSRSSVTVTVVWRAIRPMITVWRLICLIAAPAVSKCLRRLTPRCRTTQLVEERAGRMVDSPPRRTDPRPRSPCRQRWEQAGTRLLASLPGPNTPTMRVHGPRVDAADQEAGPAKVCRGPTEATLGMIGGPSWVGG